MTNDKARAFFLLVVVLCVALSAHPVPPSLDTWAHAAIGKAIWDTKRVPDRALFLWSSSEPWVAHSWLAQVTFYLLVSADGTGDGEFPLRLFTAVVTTAAFLLVWRLWAERAPPGAWAVFVFSLGVYCSAGRYQPRPELFTALCLTVLLTALYRRTARPDGPVRRDLITGAGLAALFVVWTNAHGGVAVGVGLLGATVVCDLVQDRFDRRSRRLALIALLCVASTIVNPYGLSYWEMIRPTNSYIFSNIVEWQPVWSEPVVQWDRLLALGVLFGVAVASSARSPRRRWAELAWLVGTGAALLSARRHIWLLSLVSLIVIAAHADRLPLPELWGALVGGRKTGPTDRRSDGGGPGRGVGLCGAWVGLLVVASWLSVDWDPPPPRPDGAAQFLRDKHTGGRVLNFYEGSSYLQWRLAGNPPLFIDLLNAYPDQVMIDYKEFVRFTPRAKALLDDKRIDWVILTTSVPVPILDLRLAQFLTRSAVWAEVYRDDVAIIWVRRTAAPEPLRRAAPE